MSGQNGAKKRKTKAEMFEELQKKFEAEDRKRKERAINRIWKLYQEDKTSLSPAVVKICEEELVGYLDCDIRLPRKSKKPRVAKKQEKPKE
jgi:Fe-S-cluster-containing hydrogenase component 2